MTDKEILLQKTRYNLAEIYHLAEDSDLKIIKGILEDITFIIEEFSHLLLHFEKELFKPRIFDFYEYLVRDDGIVKGVQAMADEIGNEKLSKEMEKISDFFYPVINSFHNQLIEICPELKLETVQHLTE